MGVPLSLLGSFPPSEWSEELYVKAPPYIVENAGGRVSLLPTRPETELIFDNLAPSLGLKKRKQGHTYYVVARSDVIKAFRQFDWYLRRSWRNKDFAVLWAVIYIAETKRWKSPGISLDSVAELSGCETKECARILEELLNAKIGKGQIQGFSEYEVEKQQVRLALEKLVSQLPTWTEEIMMSTLCSGTGGSVGEVYERIMMQGITIGATYKIVERLKAQGYIYALRHFRVNERGPMRELLSANCRNCFYGYSTEERCLLDTFRQLEDILERYYERKLTGDERTSLYLSIKSIPYCSRISRRVLESLRLIHQVQRMTKEGRVLSMLKKIEERYGIELPIKAET